MRCPDCNKFVPLDTDGDPEVELEADETTGEVTGTVRIVNACQECGAELTESTFDVDVEFEGAAAHMEKYPEDEAHSLDLPEPDVERTCRQQGRGRGTRTFYGAQASLTVRCRCGFEEAGHWEDESQASSMDSLN
jgi:hypothetical protein